MASTQQATVLRRSTRQRKEISYDELLGSPESSTELDSSVSHKRKRGPKPKPFEPAFHSISVDKRANTIHSSSREGRIYAMAGSDGDMQRQLFEKMEKWRNVFDNVPEELLDFSVGWGTCTGDWDGKVGDRQNVKTFSSVHRRYPWLTVVAQVKS